MAGILNWDLGDSSNNVNANSFSHTYSSPGIKCVSVYKGTASGPGNITYLDLSTNSLVGTLDISCLTNLASLYVHGNRKLTKIINPVSSTQFYQYDAFDCSLNGILDVSGMTGLGYTFDVKQNQNLTNVLNPSTNSPFSVYSVNNCNITGTLDLRPVKRLGGNFNASFNPSLNTILLPDSSAAFSYFYVHNCSLNGTLDCSSLTGLGGQFYTYNNRGLTKILNPVSTQSWNQYRVNNCNLTGVLDCSGLSRVGGNFEVYGNPNLTNVLLPDPSTSTTFSTAYFNDCSLKTFNFAKLRGTSISFSIENNEVSAFSNLDLSLGFNSFNVKKNRLIGTLDVSKFSSLIGFSADFNPQLNQVVMPPSVTYFSSWSCSSCNLLGPVDLSTFGYSIGGTINISYNPNLQRVIWPRWNGIDSFTGISVNVQNCSLNSASVDGIFSQMRAYWTGKTPGLGNSVVVNATGGGNAKPSADGSTNIAWFRTLWGIYGVYCDIQVK